MKYFLSLLFLIIAGCSGSGTSGFSTLDPDNGSFSNVDYKLAIQTGPFEGKLVVDQIRNSQINILIPVGFNSHIPMGAFNFSQFSLSGAVTQDENGYKTIELKVPVSQIVQGVNSTPVSALPNGDTLDFFPSGVAQHYEVALDTAGKVVMHVYVSAPYLLGVFIQTPFDLASSNKYWVVPSNGINPVGFFSTHPHRPPLNGGAFLFISLPR